MGWETFFGYNNSLKAISNFKTSVWGPVAYKIGWLESFLVKLGLLDLLSSLKKSLSGVIGPQNRKGGEDNITKIRRHND